MFLIDPAEPDFVIAFSVADETTASGSQQLL